MIFSQVFVFIQAWMILSLLSSIIMLPLLLLGQDVTRLGNGKFEYWIGTVCAAIFIGPVELRGLEKVPRDGKGRVFVMNHQSQADICILYYLHTIFVWISKKSVTYIPGVGQIMQLSGHILLERKGKSSIKAMYAAAKDRLSQGKNIFIFPQGTRERTKVLPFKHGAFSIAVTEQVDVVPVSIHLEGSTWKKFFFYGYLFGREEAKKTPQAIITVHDTMNIKDYKGEGAKEKMMEDAQKVVYSVLGENKKSN
jgi:1-acyl-sn-glycerol-3-phosphate acyltransferase